MPHSEDQKIGRRAGIVAFFTFLSRIFGLVRDVVLAYFFGATRVADAFYVAFRIPNLLRRLTAEGALTISFVPIFSDYLKRSEDEGRRVASVVFTYLSIVLVIIVMGGILLAPYIVRVIAYGFADDPEKFHLTVYLTRLMFPYIFLISLTALAMGILNSLKHFAAPAAAPIVLNICIITGALLFSRWFTEPTIGLALGVLIGGLLQVSMQIPILLKKKMLPRLNFDYTHPGLRRLLLLMIPAAFGAAVYQVNVLVITFLASFLPHGSVSYLWYADRVTEFPLGIFAIAIATATLPSLADYASDKDLTSFKRTFRFGLSGAFAITIPSAIGLFILAVPVIRLLFERGEFTELSTAGTAGALSFFVIGLPFVSGVRNIVPAFFALKDAKTPVFISSAAVVCNAVVAFLLMKPMLHKGLVVGLIVADVINFSLLFYFLRRKVGVLGGRLIIASIFRTLFSAIIMGVIVWVFKSHIVAPLFVGTFLELLLGVLLSIILGLCVYIVILKMIGAPEYKVFADLFKRIRSFKK